MNEAQHVDIWTAAPDRRKSENTGREADPYHPTTYLNSVGSSVVKMVSNTPEEVRLSRETRCFFACVVRCWEPGSYFQNEAMGF